YAHIGQCPTPEALSTFGVSAAVAVLLFRPWRRSTSMSAKLTRLALPAVLALTVTAAGCGGSSGKSSSNTTNRPTTDARIQILEPTPNQTTGRNVTLKVSLIGAKVVQPATGAPKPDEGHIHVSLDGALPAATLAALFLLLLAVGWAWPRVSGGRASASVSAGAALAPVVAVGVGAFVLGRLVGGGHAPQPLALRVVALGSLAAVAEEAFFRRL